MSDQPDKWVKAGTAPNAAIRPPQESPIVARIDKVEKSRTLAAEIRTAENVASTTALVKGDLIRWLQAENNLVTVRNPDAFEWIYALGSEFAGYNAADFLQDSMYGNDPKLIAKEAKFAQEMYDLLKTQPIKEGEVAVTLRRFRVRDGDPWTYRVMAIFPEGSQIIDPKFQGNDVTTDRPGIIYYKAGVNCVNHACDELYKSNGGKDQVFYLKYFTPEDFYRSSDVGGVIEFKDRTTGQRRDPGPYLMTSLLGCFTNELSRFRIPKKLLEKEF